MSPRSGPRRHRFAGASAPRPVSAMQALLAIGGCLVLSAGTLQGATPTNSAATAEAAAAPQTIGIEGRETIELARADYRVKPVDDRTELILRIEKVEPAAGGRQRYWFHFIGLEPGTYRLADYLIRPDGSRPDELGDARLLVRSILPEDHNGQLNLHVPRSFPFIGGYRAALAALGVIWIGGLVGFALVGRRRRPRVAVSTAEPEPSFADRLRPLVEAAALGQLSTDGQASLERLLMGYWRDRLALPEMRMADALARLKAHADAGTILRAVERWLHQPGSAGASEIRTLLQPYRRRPGLDDPARGGAA